MLGRMQTTDCQRHVTNLHIFSPCDHQEASSPVPHFSRPLREVGTLILKEIFAGKQPLRLTPSLPNCQTSLPRRSTKPLISAASTISQEVPCVPDRISLHAHVPRSSPCRRVRSRGLRFRPLCRRIVQHRHRRPHHHPPDHDTVHCPTHEQRRVRQLQSLLFHLHAAHRLSRPLGQGWLHGRHQRHRRSSIRPHRQLLARTHQHLFRHHRRTILEPRSLLARRKRSHRLLAALYDVAARHRRHRQPRQQHLHGNHFRQFHARVLSVGSRPNCSRHR